MKNTYKVLAGLALASSLFISVAPLAQADVATSTPAVGGHRHAYIAGSVDSINNKGQWCLSNTFPYFRTIFYTTSPACNIGAVLALMNYK